MKQKPNSFPSIVQRYYPLLYRYARRIIHDEEAARNIACKALMEMSSNDIKKQPSCKQRQLLKTNTLRYCRCWLLNEALKLRHRKE